MSFPLRFPQLPVSSPTFRPIALPTTAKALQLPRPHRSNSTYSRSHGAIPKLQGKPIPAPNESLETNACWKQDVFLLASPVRVGRLPHLNFPMDPVILKTLHVAGVIGLFTSLGATLLAGSGKKGASALHGISLLLIAVVGFAILKKPPMDAYWWMVKLALWLFIGAAPALVKRKLLPAWMVLSLCIAAGIVAAWLGLALKKPF
jgi:hypothetical protein